MILFISRSSRALLPLGKKLGGGFGKWYHLYQGFGYSAKKGGEKIFQKDQSPRDFDFLRILP